MIIFNQNTNNTFAVTTTEKVTLTGTPYYTMVIQNVMLEDEIIFNITDTSTATTRYNLFECELTTFGNEDLANHIIYVPAGSEGAWDYTIYEASAQTLSISACTSNVESGKLKIIASGSTTADYNYTSTGQTGNNTYYFN